MTETIYDHAHAREGERGSLIDILLVRVLFIIEMIYGHTYTEASYYRAIVFPEVPA